MEILKIDRTKLKTVKSYAEMQGQSVQYIYRLVNEKRLKLVIIDGVKFIHI